MHGLSSARMVAEASLSTKAVFENFIERQAGSWASERTYHYFNNPKYGDGVERSTTVFDVRALDDAGVQEVAEANKVRASQFAHTIGIGIHWNWHELAPCNSSDECLSTGENLTLWSSLLLTV